MVGSETNWAMQISTHAPLARCDTASVADFASASISTHAPLARCDYHTVLRRACGSCISTHAPLARCDTNPAAYGANKKDFNSRTSCEVRPIRRVGKQHVNLFQLTHLLRGATGGAVLPPADTQDFNSRTSCEVRPRPPAYTGRPSISTHAPLARCDTLTVSPSLRSMISTHAPLARCDLFTGHCGPPTSISTHAPLARCDLFRSSIFAMLVFQLTHLLRGATGIGALLTA